MKPSLLVVIALIFLTAGTLQSFAAFVIPRSVPVEVPVKRESTSLSSAMSEFRHLSGKERRSRIKEAKVEIREFKAERRAGSEPSTNQLLLVILAILLPPLAVYLHEGEINNKFWLDLVLTLLFFIPGVIYALIVVLGKD